MADADIKARWTEDAVERDSALRERAVICAALTDPSILPPEAVDTSQEHRELNTHRRLPEAFTSVGARGMTILDGLMSSALFPFTQPFFELRPTAEIGVQLREADAQNGTATYEDYLARLANIGAVAMAVLESAGTGDRTNRRPMGFRSSKSMSIRQILATGDSLEKMGDDYRVRTFRRDQYVTRRDSAGDVLYHITAERIDPLSLSQDQLRAVDLDVRDMQELREKHPAKRLETLYTEVRWNPESKTWVMRQQVRGNLIPINGAELEAEEQVSPYFSTVYKLSPNDDYGRGFVETNVLGDLRSLNEIEKHRLDLLFLAAKQHPILDHGEVTTEDELMQPTGTPVRTRVEGGEAQGLGVFSFGSIGDYQMLTQGAESRKLDLARTMLIESASAPNKDRVTATQIQRIAQELEGALGGVYTQIADDQHLPLVQRLLYQLERDDLIEPLTRRGGGRTISLAEVKTLTGLVALQRESQRVKLLDFAQFVSLFGERGIASIDMDVAFSAYQRLAAIDMPGLVKSPEQVAQEEQQRLASVAAERGIDAAGTVVEQAAQQAPQQTPQQTQ
ncbi:MAG: portal protein [Planctomycetota bacterium]